MSEYLYWISAIATSKAAGNALAAAVAAEPGDPTAFDRSTPLYQQGTTFSPADSPISPPVASNPPSAWFVGVCAKQTAYDVAAEYAGNGPYPLLNARGFTDQQIAGLKSLVKVSAGPRSIEANVGQFISSNGYVTP